MIQHDMMMVDHGPPTADGKLSPNQRQKPTSTSSSRAVEVRRRVDEVGLLLARGERAFATHYPASVGPHMTNTDSDPFKDLVPALSLRENERGSQIGGTGIRRTISRLTCSRRSTTRISCSA
jgi:hypothetical protein